MNVQVKDSPEEKCSTCGAFFWFLLRKHHCVKCGNNFCTNCTQLYPTTGNTKTNNQTITSTIGSSNSKGRIAPSTSRICSSCVLEKENDPLLHEQLATIQRLEYFSEHLSQNVKRLKTAQNSHHHNNTSHNQHPNATNDQQEGEVERIKSELSQLLSSLSTGSVSSIPPNSNNSTRVGELENQMTELTNENHQLKRKLDDFQSELDKCKTENQRIENERLQLIQISECFHTEKSTHLSQIHQLSIQNSEYQSQVTQLLSQNEQLQHKINLLENQIKNNKNDQTQEKREKKTEDSPSSGDDKPPQEGINQQKDGGIEALLQSLNTPNNSNHSNNDDYNALLKSLNEGSLAEELPIDKNNDAANELLSLLEKPSAETNNNNATDLNSLLQSLDGHNQNHQTDENSHEFQFPDATADLLKQLEQTHTENNEIKNHGNSTLDEFPDATADLLKQLGQSSVGDTNTNQNTDLDSLLQSLNAPHEERNDHEFQSSVATSDLLKDLEQSPEDHNNADLNSLLQSLNTPHEHHSEMQFPDATADLLKQLEQPSSPSGVFPDATADLLKQLEQPSSSPSSVVFPDATADLLKQLEQPSSPSSAGFPDATADLLKQLEQPSSSSPVVFPDATSELMKLLGTGGAGVGQKKGSTANRRSVKSGRVKQPQLRSGLEDLWATPESNNNNVNNTTTTSAPLALPESHRDGAQNLGIEDEVFGVMYRSQRDRDVKEEKERERELVYAYGVKTETNKAGLKRAKKSVVKMGKKVFQNEDEHFCEYPFFGRKDLAFFAIFDGHVDRNAAVAASQALPAELLKLIPEAEGTISKKDFSAEWVISYQLADEKLKEFEYEGTTVTTVLLWLQTESPEIFHKYLQVANLGDSNAYLLRGDKIVELTEEHRVTNPKEQARMRLAGQDVAPTQTRINGLSVSRALGDHFVKQNAAGLSATPHISDAILLTPDDTFLVIASDGLWDVTSAQGAIDTIKRMKEPQEMAKRLIMDALKKSGCVDNLTVIVVCL